MANDSKSLELQIRIATQEALKAVSSLKGEVHALANEAHKFAGDGGAKLKDSFKEAERAAKETSVSIGDIKKAVVSLAEVAAAAKALSVIKDMGAFALETADSFQTARNQFGTLLGDMEAGAGLFNQIKAFNDKTPFDLSTLTQATNVLIAAKVPLQDLQGQLTKFGDLSQGNSQKMTSYVNAFSQAAAKGKADMQVLNTYIHQGVPILDELAKNFGVTTAEIVDMSSKGQISFADFSQALDDLTAAGGQYFGGMELASQSLEAMQEGLKESANTLAASFGEMLLPAAIGVTGILTELADAINEHPMVKGLLAGAIVAVTGLMAAMAVKAVIMAAKTWLAQAAQMGLNASLAVTNPLLLAGIAAAAAATVAAVAYASAQQQAARGTENNALRQRQLNDALRDGAGAARDGSEEMQRYFRQAQDFSLEVVRNEIRRLNTEIAEMSFVPAVERGNLRTLMERLKQHRDDFIKEFYDATGEDKIRELNNVIRIAQEFVVDVDISAEEKTKLEEIIKRAREEIDNLAGGIEQKAAKWKEAWAETWNKFQADTAHNPLYDIELEHRKKLKDAWDNYVRSGDTETIKQVNEYYDAKRGEIIKQLGEEEKRIQRELSKTKIDDLEYEKKKALEVIEELREQRIFTAGYTGEDIQAVRDEFETLLNDTKLKFEIEIDETKLDEARQAVKDWQQELSDSLTRALMDLEIFGSEAAVVIGDLSARLIELSASAALSGFEEFGRALGEGKDAAESLERALADMCQQILRQLPMMFLQAGLQLIANGQWPLGLGFIAAAGSSAIISGYVDGKQSAAQANARGGVYDEYGRAAREFASGGAFTNQIVSTPTYFKHGGGLGLMGEAGPEAIMPLKRMPGGDLGVETAGGGGTRVTVNIINNTGAEVRQEEYEDTDGGKQIDVIIGSLVNNHIASGKADRVMGGRYGLRAQGV